MAYTAFAENKPVASDTGLVVVDDMRANLMALRDYQVSGRLFGFDYSVVTGTDAAPTEILYSSGTERVKILRVWDANSPVRTTKNRYYYSSDSGGSYDFIKREVIAYTGVAVDITTTTWDDTDA